MTVLERIERQAVTLTDEQLARELYCAEQCVLRTTRTRRQLALLRMRCLSREMERRRGDERTTLTLVQATKER